MPGIFTRKKKYVKERKTKDAYAPLPEEAGAQAERIAALRAEVERLTAELNEYRGEEREIRDALNFARARSEEYEKEARIRFALEAERLAAYRDKWRSRLNALGSAEKLGEELLECQRFFGDCVKELSAVIEGEPLPSDPPRDQYYSECVRLNELGVSADTSERRLSDEELDILLTQLGNK